MTTQKSNTNAYNIAEASSENEEGKQKRSQHEEISGFLQLFGRSAMCSFCRYRQLEQLPDLRMIQNALGIFYTLWHNKHAEPSLSSSLRRSRCFCWTRWSQRLVTWMPREAAGHYGASDAPLGVSSSHLFLFNCFCLS